MDRLWPDLVQTLRALLRTPMLALAAVVSLGAGLGASTTVFSWMDNLVLRPYPAVADPDRLVALEVAAPNDTGWFLSYPNYREWRDGSRSFSGVAAWTLLRAALREEGARSADPALGMSVSGNYFDVLRVGPALGRVLTPADERESAGVAVLDHGYWLRRFGASPGVVGKTVFLNGEPVEVVGVAPERFAGTYVGVVPNLYVPLTLQPRLTGVQTLEDRGNRWLSAFARLAPGVEREQARGELDGLARRLSRAANDRPVTGARVIQMREQFLGSLVFPLFSAMLAVTGLLLLVASANVASLLLVRASGRRQELALRFALGASRGRLVRLLLIESAILALAGGVFGVSFAYLARGALYFFVPVGPIPVSVTIELNTRVLSFAFAACAVATLACGLLPALRATASGPAALMRTSSRSATAGGARLRSGVVAAQLAVSLACLVCAGLFVRALRATGAIDSGYADPGRLLLVGTDLAAARLPEAASVAALGHLLERVRALPGATAATAASMVPLGFGGHRLADVRVEGRTFAADENPSAERVLVASDYFETMGTPLLEGRSIANGDVSGALAVAVVNQAFARRLLGASALGARIDMGHGWATVVGVARDTKYDRLTEAPRPVAFFPVAQWFQPGLTIHVRAAGEPLALVEPVRRALAGASPDLPALQPRTFAEHSRAATFTGRVGAGVLSGFGLLALALSAVGLHGVLGYSVSLRSRELGVRLALGASARAIAWLVARQALAVTSAGLLAGTALAFAGSRALSAQLAGLPEGSDPATFVAGGAVLLAAAALATWLPARRALRIDPALTLRGD